MPLVTGNLEKEMKELVEKELPDSDPATAGYISQLFATARLPRQEEIRWNWIGLTAQDDKKAIGLKLRHSRQIGDGCLVLCTFYKEETRHEPGLELADLGKAGYNVAGFYAAAIGDEKGIVYRRLADGFLQIIVRLGPPIFRNYLGDTNPPQRIIVYTPHGERLLRLRHSMS